MPSLPSYVKTGAVLGKQLVVGSDTYGDADIEPDATYPVGATLTITPSVPYLLFAGSAQRTTVYLDPVVATINASGDPVTANGDALRLVANVGQPDGNPLGWYWTVTPRVGDRRVLPFRLDVVADSTAYLSDAQPIPASVGNAVVKGDKGDKGDPGDRLIVPANMVDGQLIAWSATLGEWVPVNPAGPSELAASQNVSGVATGITTPGGVGAMTDILGCTISVPASVRPVEIEFGATFYQTVVGSGSLYLELNETTGGAVTLRQSAIAPAPQRSGVIDASQCVLSLDSRCRLGPTATARQFKLSAQLYTAAGTLTGQFLNGATSPSYLRAIAR